MTNKKKNETIKWDDLIRKAVCETYGRSARVRKTYFTEQDKDKFIQILLSDARNINPKEPVEISRNTVDVNEKVYINQEGSQDESTIKIVNCVENSEGHNYVQTTTKGLEFGGTANLGLQFGLPQVGGVSGGLGGSINRKYERSTTEETTKTNKVELQSHHEETVKIPAGNKVVVTMTSYRVRYKLEYTMEYKVDRTQTLRVSYDSCGLGLPCGTSMGQLAPSQLLDSLPGFREDEKYVYFCQEGELRWIADRMVVKKEVIPL